MFQFSDTQLGVKTPVVTSAVATAYVESFKVAQLIKKYIYIYRNADLVKIATSTYLCLGGKSTQ